MLLGALLVNIVILRINSIALPTLNQHPRTLSLDRLNFQPKKIKAAHEESQKAKEEAKQIELIVRSKKHPLSWLKDDPSLGMPLSDRAKRSFIVQKLVEFEIPESIQNSKSGLSPLALDEKNFDQIQILLKNMMNRVCDIYEEISLSRLLVHKPIFQSPMVLELKERIIFIEKYIEARWGILPKVNSLDTVELYLVSLKGGLLAQKNMAGKAALMNLAKGGAVVAAAFALANILQIGQS